MTESISLLGDSQMQGLATMGRLSAVLASRGFQVTDATYRAGASSHALRSLMPSRVARTLLICAGGNDTPTSQADWRALIAQARTAGARRIIWVTPPGAVGDAALDERRRRIAEAQTATLNALDVMVLSGRVLAQSLPRRDEVHLTAPGYVTFAARLAAAIRPDAVAAAGYAKYVVGALALGVLGYVAFGGSR